MLTQLTQWLRRTDEIDRRVRGAFRDALTMPIGQISLTEARFLSGLVASLPTIAGPIVEIGTLFGWSTKVMALAKVPERRLMTVDAYVWNPFGLGADEHFAITSSILDDAVRHHGVEIVRADKAEFYRSYAGPAPGLVFLDADHSYEQTLLDIQWAQRVGAGVIALHDFSPEFEGVVQAVQESGGPGDLVGTLVTVRQ